MADRKASVTLELKAAQFKAEAAASEESVDGLDRKVEKLDRDINKIPTDAAKAAAGLEVLGGTAKEVGNDVDNLGKKTEEVGKKTAAAGEDTKSMRARMDELKDSLKTTGAELARNSDPELFKKFKADSSELKGLESMVGKMEKLGLNVKQLGLESQKAEGLFSSLQAGAEGGLSSPLGLGLAGIAAGPALAAAGGLALGGIGFLGAGAGVASAVMGNPQAFQAAWGAAAGEVKKDFLDAGNAFVGPTMKAIESIGPTIDSWHLDKALAPAAKYVPVIVAGLEGAASGVEHGFADAIGKAGPAVQALSTGMKDLGDAAGTALSEIADGADGGAQALHDVLGIVSGIIIGFGGVVDAAEHAYSFIQDHPIALGVVTGGLTVPASLAMNALGNVTDGEKTLASVLPGTNLALEVQQHDLDALSKTLKDTTVTADNLAGRMTDKVVSSLLAADHATLSWHESLTQLSESFKQNGKSIDENTAKGQANREAVLRSVEANIKIYDSNIASGQTAAQAAAAYDVNTKALEANLRKAGLTAGQIDQLIGTYKSVPDRVNTNIAVEGLTNAINDLDDLIRRLNGIPSRKDVTIYTHTGSVGGKEPPNLYGGGSQPAPTPVHNPHPHAAGGILDPGWNLVGEEGPELIRDGRVYPTGLTRSMMSAGWSGSGGGGQIAVALSIGAGANLTPLGSLLNQMLRDGLFVVKASQVRAG